jgi:hypothetical protein
MYGPERLLKEVTELGHTGELRRAGDLDFVVISDYVVLIGRFQDRIIDLGLPATPDFPRSVGSSIHVCASPQLLESQNIPNVMNIIASPLGPDWRYWSHNFNWNGECERSAARLLSQINAIFERVP